MEARISNRYGTITTYPLLPVVRPVEDAEKQEEQTKALMDDLSSLNSDDDSGEATEVSVDKVGSFVNFFVSLESSPETSPMADQKKDSQDDTKEEVETKKEGESKESEEKAAKEKKDASIKLRQQMVKMLKNTVPKKASDFKVIANGLTAITAGPADEISEEA